MFVNKIQMLAHQVLIIILKLKDVIQYNVIPVIIGMMYQEVVNKWIVHPTHI